MRERAQSGRQAQTVDQVTGSLSARPADPPTAMQSGLRTTTMPLPWGCHATRCWSPAGVECTKLREWCV